MVGAGDGPMLDVAVALGACVFGGLLLALSTPPWGLWVLAPVGLGSVLASLTGRSFVARAALASVGFVVLHAVTLSWLGSLHVAALALIPILATFDGVIVGAAPARGPLAAPGAVAAVVLATAVRGAWPWGGVPLSNLALGQAGGPLLPAARLLTSLTVVAVVAVLAVGLVALARRRWRDVAAAGAVVIVVGVLAGVAPDGQRAGPDLTAALVQGGGALGTNARDSDQSPVIERHLVASDQIEGPIDLVVWPENAVTVDGVFAGSVIEAELARRSAERGAPFVVGVIERLGDRFTNAAVVVDASGEVDRYEKVNRVPFGEFVPFRDLVDRVAGGATSLVPRDAIVGEDPAAVDTPVGRLATVISFELFFARRVRTGVGDGGLVVLGPTNASSYPDDRVPAQTLASSRLRAVETGRWVLQAAPTGYSAVVAEDGRVVERTGLRSPTVIEAEVEPREGETWAVRWGSAPLVVLAGAVLIAAWVAAVLAGRRPGPAGTGGPSPGSGPSRGTGEIADRSGT